MSPPSQPPAAGVSPSAPTSPRATTLPCSPAPSAGDPSRAIGVLGLWHLGSVTAACLAEAGNEVIGVDPDPGVVAALARGRAPVYEPGLTELIAGGAERLRFASDPRALAPVRQAWITFDTPVDERDHADTEWVLAHAARLVAWLPEGALVVVSSQLPVGSVARLQERCSAIRGDGGLRFACIPENLRLGNALESFRAPERIVAGVRSEEDRIELAELLAPFSANVLWMRVESAEMLKHALNGFLATSIAFVNEVAEICESVGADATEVSLGLKSDSRIGPRAYLNPGDAFAGGTLARDIGFLRSAAERHRLTSHVSTGVARGNAAHREWARRTLLDLLGVEWEGAVRREGAVEREPVGQEGAVERKDAGSPSAERPLAGRVVAVWGLTYKPDTDTLRRSSAVELCRWLAQAGARVCAYDPAVRTLPATLQGVLELCHSPLDAAAGAQALVICVAHPEFRDIAAERLLAALDQHLVVDSAGWLADSLGAREDVRYARVGVAREPQRHAPLGRAAA